MCHKKRDSEISKMPAPETCRGGGMHIGDIGGRKCVLMKGGKHCMIEIQS